MRRPLLAACLGPVVVGGLALAVTATRAHALAPPLRVDLGMNTGRSDTATPGWQEWQIPDGGEASREFEGIRVTLRPAGKGGDVSLRGVWNKRLLLTSPMAADGVVVDRGGLEIQLDGLPPGRHTLVTYHSTVSGPETGRYTLAVAGRDVQSPVAPSREVADNADAGSGYVEFLVDLRETIVVRVTSDSDADVILNGFEIDGADPAKKALKPYPADLDWHVDADDETFELSWQAVPGAVQYRQYITSSVDPADAESSLLMRDDPELIADASEVGPDGVEELMIKTRF